MTMRISGVHPSPFGIALVVLLLVGSMYYLVHITTSPGLNEQVSIKQLLVAGIDIAERGGQEVKEVHNDHELQEKSKGKTREGANDPLTNGDLRSHRVMMETFRQTFPFVKIISEEKEKVEQSGFIKKTPLFNREVDSLVGKEDEVVDVNDVTVWIDPLDATQEYTENLLEYVTTMVCVAVKGVPVVGIVHKPFEDKTYWSWVGHGSNIHAVSKDDDGHAVIISRSHKGDVAETARQAFGDKVSIVPAGGAGFKSLALFNGKASVYVHTTLIKKWDICAGSAILRNAGGSMTTLKGEAIDFSAAANPKNEGGLIAALRGHDEYLKKIGFAISQ